MDIRQGELVEKELDAMIVRRDTHRRQSEEDRRVEDLWMPSARAYHARKQEDLNAAWYAHEMRMCNLHAALSEEHRERAQKYRQNGHRNLEEQ